MEKVAIKTIKKSKIETEADLIRIRREIQIMSSVRHPNIIHIYEVFENREKMVLVMEYAAGRLNLLVIAILSLLSLAFQ